MYELKIEDFIVLLLGLGDDFFGPAKNLHGTTYIIDLMLQSEELIENIIIDIGLATDILENVISKYNYKNLDDLEELKGNITTTEFMAKRNSLRIFFINLSVEVSPSKKLSSIKITLKENHLASASYTKAI